jgi:uncharacterized membrane protein YhaH (DUF805 family)
MTEADTVGLTPPLGARCAVHPETMALLTCPRCGDYACGACTGIASGGLCGACQARQQAAAARMSLVNLFFGLRGRINRARYWFGMLSLWFALVAVVVIQRLVTSASEQPNEGPPEVFIGLLSLAFAWPWIAVHVKRWHDRGKSGHWILITLIPGIGGPWTFAECGCLPGTAGPNRYGADPLARPT